MNSQLKLDFSVIYANILISDKWKVESSPTLLKSILTDIFTVPTLQVSAFPFVAIWEALKGGLLFGQGGE